MPLIYLDDIRLNALIEGPASGPPLVLLHALGTNLTLWDEVLPHLPQTLRVLRFDARGHGVSDTSAPPYAMGALVRDAERLMVHFGLKDAVVVGVSMGGMVAQGLAVKRLDLVRAMVLSNTAARIGTPEIWGARIAEVARSGLEPYADGAMERMLGPRWRSVPGMPRLRAMLTDTNPQGWIGCAGAISGTDFYTSTAGLTLPTLAIAGANDASTPPDLVRETADLIRGSRFALLRGAGHLPMVEKPAEYAVLLTGFLRDIGHL